MKPARAAMAALRRVAEVAVATASLLLYVVLALAVLFLLVYGHWGTRVVHVLKEAVQAAYTGEAPAPWREQAGGRPDQTPGRP